jgi:hypothetical protein
MDLQKVISQKKFGIGAGSGSVCQRNGSENLDHCRRQFPFFRFLSGVKGTRQLERMKDLIKINEKSSSSWGGGGAGGSLKIDK